MGAAFAVVGVRRIAGRVHFLDGCVKATIRCSCVIVVLFLLDWDENRNAQDLTTTTLACLVVRPDADAM